MTPLPRILLALNLASVIPVANRAEAQTPAHDDNLEHVVEYGATIADVDRVSSTGQQLSDIAALLQQDRFNVDVRRIQQKGDSEDGYFNDKDHRLEIIRAVVNIADDEARAAFASGTPSLRVTVTRRRNDGRLAIFIATSDGAPADKVADSSPRQRRPFHEFPQGFQGRWAYAAADCRAGASPATLTIDARGLNQAEGSLVVISILQARDNPGQISVNAHNSGGGGEWDSQEEFTLSKDGQVIEWQRLEPDPGPVTRLYRCKEGP